MSVEQSTDIMKVFSHCPFKKMWKFSMPEGQRTALIHSFRLCFRGILCPPCAYLSECGVLGTFISGKGPSTTFLKIDGISSTLEPNNVLYLSDYQIIHSIFFVV